MVLAVTLLDCPIETADNQLLKILKRHCRQILGDRPQADNFVFEVQQLITTLLTTGQPKIDAVAIATPVSTHYDLALQALQAGKHVLVEKPLTDSSKKAERLVAEAESRQLVLAVDHTFVYTAAVRKIRELVQSGELGDLYYYDSVRVNLGLFQHDVSVLWDLAVHDLAILAAVFPEDPVAVSATRDAFTFSGKAFIIEEMAHLLLRGGDRPRVEVLNGTGVAGSTAPVAATLVRGGFRVIRTGNADANANTDIFLVPAGGGTCARSRPRRRPTRRRRSARTEASLSAQIS